MNVKIFLIFSMGVLMGGNCLASENPLIGSDEAAIGFGNNVADGKIDQYNSYFEEINPGDLQNDRQKANAMKNLYLAYYHAGEFVEDFRVACLGKMLEVAQSYDQMEGSVNFKIAHLLYLSQVNESQNQLAENAKTEIVEAVINKLSGAVNGDKELANRTLASFNEILKSSRLSIYASNN
ncbi:MAG: hypothetical protein LBJ13_00875 [Puniceicoccales bacterium]|jgi:hypothetical protein|nr:hypothetical protein [Puniceicoccales bacterium]